MPRDQDRHPALARVPPARAGSPYWRAALEDRWRAALQEVTELSVAYHGAAADGPDGSGTGPGHDGIRLLLLRTIAARRKLADVDDALGRLTAGTFGRCEQCGSPIGDGLLAAVPETRYCPRCATGAGPSPVPAGRAGASDTW